MNEESIDELYIEWGKTMIALIKDQYKNNQPKTTHVLPDCLYENGINYALYEEGNDDN